MMNLFWTPVLRPLLKAVNARRVIEIGADAGRNSVRLARWCQSNGAFADIIDTEPGFDVAEFDSTFDGAAKVHVAPSLQVLGDLPPADVVLIDGDHNWYTVFNEINLLLGMPDAPHPNPPVLVFHDTGWPWGRRDAYYDPERIPEQFRHPHARGQIAPGQTGWTPEGVDLGLICAKQQGGPKNGVRTAIEDALEGRADQFETVSIAAYFGLTILIPRSRLEASPGLAAFLTDMQPSAGLRAVIDLLEKSRIDGNILAERLKEVVQCHTLPPQTPKEGERPLQTTLSTETWQGIQRGMLGQTYKGRSMLLNPFDQFNYMSLIESLRPGTIFEIGTLKGGRTLWMADQLRAFGINGRILTLDLVPPSGLEDPAVEVLYGNAMDLGEVLTSEQLATLPRPWLVIEDAAHTTRMCLAVLEFFDVHLQSGDRIVIEDGNIGSLTGQPEVSPPHAAIAAFMARRGRDYLLESQYSDRYGHNMTACPNGWLVRT